MGLKIFSSFMLAIVALGALIFWADNLDEDAFEGTAIYKFLIKSGFGFKKDDEYATKEGFIRVTFNQLKTYHNIAPEKYGFTDEWIIYFDDKGSETKLFPETKEDWIKYRLWLIDAKKRDKLEQQAKTEQEQSERTKEYLKSVKDDISDYKDKIQQLYDEANDIMKSINIKEETVERSRMEDNKIVLKL